MSTPVLSIVGTARIDAPSSVLSRARHLVSGLGGETLFGYLPDGGAALLVFDPATATQLGRYAVPSDFGGDAYVIDNGIAWSLAPFQVMGVDVGSGQVVERHPLPHTATDLAFFYSAQVLKLNGGALCFVWTQGNHSNLGDAWVTIRVLLRRVDGSWLGPLELRRNSRLIDPLGPYTGYSDRTYRAFMAEAVEHPTLGGVWIFWTWDSEERLWYFHVSATDLSTLHDGIVLWRDHRRWPNEQDEGESPQVALAAEYPPITALQLGQRVVLSYANYHGLFYPYASLPKTPEARPTLVALDKIPQVIYPQYPAKPSPGQMTFLAEVPEDVARTHVAMSVYDGGVIVGYAPYDLSQVSPPPSSDPTIGGSLYTGILGVGDVRMLEEWRPVTYLRAWVSGLWSDRVALPDSGPYGAFAMSRATGLVAYASAMQPITHLVATTITAPTLPPPSPAPPPNSAVTVRITSPSPHDRLSGTITFSAVACPPAALIWAVNGVIVRSPWTVKGHGRATISVVAKDDTGQEASDAITVFLRS